MNQKRTGFSLVELLVVLAITAVLMAVLLPALQKSRSLTMTLKCGANLKQIGVSDEAYRIDWQRWFVGVGSYVPGLAEYTGTSPDFYLWQGYGTNYRKYF